MWPNATVNSKVVAKWENEQFLAPETAVKYSYDENARRWNQENVQIQLRPLPIAEGANRIVYCLRDLSLPVAEQRCVAKASKECLDGRQEPFNEVIMQVKCMKFADEYNTKNPPKRIRFLRPCVMELIQRPIDRTGGKPLMLVEPMLEGVYHKHSNNWGFVDAADRFTPQAFSHFTFAASGGRCIVVDIQGVEDCYTDPQIHSNQAAELPPVYGQGDMAVCGIQKFFESHRCNMICGMLGLTKGSGKEANLQRNTNASTQVRPCSPEEIAAPPVSLFPSSTHPLPSTTTLSGAGTSSHMAALAAALSSINHTTTHHHLSQFNSTSPPISTHTSTHHLTLQAASNSTSSASTPGPSTPSPPSSPIMFSYSSVVPPVVTTSFSYTMPRSLPMMTSFTSLTQSNPVLVYCR